MMKGSEYSELMNWDGHISSSSYHPRSPKDVPLTSFSTSSNLDPTPASYPSSTSSEQANEQDSDCYIIDQPSSMNDIFDKNRVAQFAARASIERVSMIDTHSPAHMPELFQSSSLDTMFPFQHSRDPSVTDNVSIQSESYSSPLQHSSRSAPTSRYAAESNLALLDMSIRPRSNPTFAHDDVIELTNDDDDDDATLRYNAIKNAIDSIDNDNEDEEMVVDDMLTEPAPEPDSSSSPARSPSPSLEIGGSLFTPPPSRKRRRRVILDCVSVPPFPKGMARADYRSSPKASSSAPQQGVEHPSVSHALAAAFAQNNKSPPPPLGRKGKEREHSRERPPPAPVRPKRKYKPRIPESFGDGVSTVPAQILDAQYPATELDIHELPDFSPDFDNIWQSNTYWIHVRRLQRYYARLQEGLPEMIAQMKSLAVPDENDEKEDEPILPRVLAPLFEWRPDIKASVTEQWARKRSSREGGTKQDLELWNVPSSSKSNDDISHYNTLEGDQTLDLGTEMDQYLNDLGDSPAKLYPSGIKDTRSASNAYHAFLHNTMQLPSDAALDTREDAKDSFFGVPSSPKLAPNSSSLLEFSASYATDLSRDLDANFELEESQWSLTPDAVEQKSLSSESDSPSGSVGTIDPSLLGGSEPPPKLPSSLVSPSTSLKKTKQLPAGPIIYVRRPPGVSLSQEAPVLSGNTPGKSRRNVQIKYRTSESVSVTDEGDATSSARKLNDLEVGNDVRWTAEAVTGPSAQPGARPSLKIRIRRSGIREGSDGSFVPSQGSGSASPAVSVPPLPEMKPLKVHKLPPALATPQEEEEPEAPSFCHQCRRTHTKPKMQCSKRVGRQTCGKLFCDRCITQRYPEIAFVRNSKNFICPICTGTCNCSICSRKRGEEYISMRGGGFAGSRTKSGILLVPDDSHPDQVQDGPMTPEPPKSAPQTMFWAHVYGLEGQRVGRAFIDDASASAPPLQPSKQCAPNGQSKQKAKAKPKKKPRVFIGTPLREWKIRTYRDLEPCVAIPPLVPEESYGGKGKGKAIERPRVYIGDAKWLYLPYTRMPISSHSSRSSSPDSEPELDSDGTLTPLEALEERMDWPQPEVGEAVTVTWESMHGYDRSASGSLSPDDVAKAIGVALAACGDKGE
ncbi:uncharacterized protein EDB91DRAFT_1155614 [Suillus paluster]|uniref:uncharacterized protein n=1 Tax=Suillus paluster TaxID=48578 RepID=UPI001B860A19|nr:uncharacterized protein EDB91DRAFT_1155614 [Suillus paluster]KAG1730945.1 hypothetical protein EDB91DRAFT_1155614 [Suillus paluster]